jgi:uncharacterized linocin/CFP29 family protein
MPKSNSAAAQIDSISQGDNGLVGSGSVASRLLASNFNVNSLRTQDVLRLREWIQFDQAVIMVARQRLVAVGDLFAAGLTYSVPNALGIMQVQWERFSDITGADVSMNGLSVGGNDRFELDLKSIPLPIVHKDFQVSIRQLEAYRNLGQPIDTTQAQLASRIVSEKIESILFSGTTVGSASNTIQGYTNFSDRITGSVTTASWATQATSVTTAGTIVTDILAMIAAAAAKNMFGPFMLYVPVATFTAFGNDFKANSALTILQRIKEIPGIIDVKPTANLTTSNVILVQMTSDVVDIIDGIQPTTVQWDSHGGMQVNFKVMAILVPRLKSDKTAQCGIVHYS